MLRPSFHSLWLAIATAVASLANAGTARAEREAIRIEYRAEHGCSTPDQFAERVLQLARSARLANENESARTFSVAIEGRADGRHGNRGFSGSLVVKENGRSTVARTVSGKSCAEVAEVLALATALAVDPTASPVEPDPGAHPTEPSTDGTAPSTTSLTPRGDAAASQTGTVEARRGSDRSKARPAGPGELVDDDELEESASARDLPSNPLSQSLALFVGPGVKLGASPNLAAGAVVGFETQPAHSAAWLHSIGVELALLRSFTKRVESASVTFDLAFVRPRICARIARLTHALRLASCLGAELGFLIARGEDLPYPRTERRTWAAAEGSVRLQLDLSKRWLLGFDAAGSLPFTRDNFLFEDPETPIYEIPVIGFAAGAKLGVRL
jgi:hypothetical protein